MLQATNTSKVITFTSPSYIISNYSESTGIGVSASSSQTIGLALPGQSTDEPSYREYPNTTLTGSSYAIELVNFAISCDSTSYTVVILNTDDITKVGTINEVYRYSNINLTTRDVSKIIYMNRDATLTNNLYLYIINNDSANATGTIYTEITFIPLQDREF